MSGENLQPAPLAERIATLRHDYEMGDVNWTDYSRKAIGFAAERFDQVRVTSGKEPIHSTILADLFKSPKAKWAWGIGYSGNPPQPSGYGTECAQDYDTMRQAITQQFGNGYVPAYLMREILFDHDSTGHFRSRAEAVLRTQKSEPDIEEPNVPEPYFALFLLDLLAWNSVRHVHDQFQKNIDMRIIPIVAEGMEKHMWTLKVEAFQKYSGFATKALWAVQKKATTLWGQNAPEALHAFRAMTFLNRGAFARQGKGPGVFRIEVMQLLAEGNVDDANTRVLELVYAYPQYFSSRTRKMYLNEDQSQRT